MRPPATPPEFYTWTMSDGYKVRGRLWRPAGGRPDVATIYLHGIQSHGGWFEWSASLLAEGGGPVLLPDRRGSGLNESARGDTRSAQRWLQDIDECADWAAAKFGVERFAVVGVSWGGKLAAAWAHRRPERVERLLLIAPGMFPAVDLTTLAKVRVAWSLLCSGGGRFAIPLDNPELFTDNPAGQRFIRADAHRLTHVSARFLWQSRQLDRKLSGMAAGALYGPITLILAGQDRIIRNDATEAWTRRVAAQTPTVRTFDRAAHTLEFDPDVAVFAAALHEWQGAQA